MNGWEIAEKIAVVSGLGSAWLERTRNIYLYPLGILSVLIYIVLCYRTGIYADMLINGYYLVMSIYGWWLWSKRVDAHHHVPVSQCSRNENLRWLCLSVGLWVGLYYWLIAMTDSTIPVIDSCTTALAFVGMILLAQRKIETWYYWIVTNAISAPMFYHKGLEATAVQFLILLAISIDGYRRWRRELRPLPV